MPNVAGLLYPAFGLFLIGTGAVFATAGLTLLWPPFGVWLFGLWP